MIKTVFLFCTTFVFCFSVMSQKLTMQRQYLSIVVDGSYSMNSPIGEESKISLVQNALIPFFEKLENYGEIQSSLSTFGTQKKSTDDNICTDYKIIVPFEMGNTSKLIAMTKRIVPLGGSPISQSSDEAVKTIPASGTKKYVIVIVDGGDACQKPVCDMYKDLDAQTNGIFIIGIGIPKEDQALFNCSATFANADNAIDLENSLNRIFELIKPY